jgi:hypothetical protein
MSTARQETTIRPTCPGCGSRDVDEMVSTRVWHPIARIDRGEAETRPGRPSGDGELDGYECQACFHSSTDLADFVAPDPEFVPTYEPWRHGGWYVYGVRHKNGGVGCVSRNYPDSKWRIVCDGRDGDYTYSSRDEAARAEYSLTRSGVIE